MLIKCPHVVDRTTKRRQFLERLAEWEPSSGHRLQKKGNKKNTSEVRNALDPCRLYDLF